MKTAIVTDSNSGIFPEEGEKRGVFILPMPVILDGQEYFEGVNLTSQTFYEKLRDGAEASTSQPAPGDVLALWKKIFAQGFDQIVHIPMSSGLSSSCHTALALAEEHYDGSVFVVDNHRVSVTLRDAVLDALRLKKQGKSAREIQKALEDNAFHSLIYLGVDTLKYFKKNGRCTAAAAALSAVLGIKPLLCCDGERFDVCAKIRGAANCRKKELEAALETAQTLRTGPDTPLSIGAASSFTDPGEASRWFEQVREAFPQDDVHYEPLPFSVVCHTGPDAFGMGISRKL